MKTYDRAQVLQVAAQILGRDDWSKQALYEAVYAAKLLIDEVERQCPLPGKPEPAVTPTKRGRCGSRWHSDDCDCNGDGG